MSTANADDPTARMFSRLPPDVVRVFMGVEAEFLDSAFSGMTEQYGSVDAYLEQAIGLSADDRVKLKQLYTEPISR
jgi:protein-tyrosine phosphatase